MPKSYISAKFLRASRLLPALLSPALVGMSAAPCVAQDAVRPAPELSTRASRPVLMRRERPKTNEKKETTSNEPEIRLSGQLPFFYTSNASAFPNFADRDGLIAPSTRLTVTFNPKDDLNLQFFGETNSELYRRQYLNGFTRFSAGFWLKYRWGNFDFAGGYAERRTQDQERFGFIVENHDINFKGSYYARLSDDVTFIPTFYAIRKFATFRRSTRSRLRLELPLTKYIGDWSVSLVPWFNFEYFERNRPVRRDISVNMDVEVRYRLSNDTWVSILATATKNFSNYPGNRYRRLDVGPILGFTTKF